MKQYTFKDGFKCVASTKEEAIAQHKIVAGKKNYEVSDFNKSLLKSLGFQRVDGDHYVLKSLDAYTHYHGGFTIYINDSRILDIDTDEENDLFYTGREKGLSDDEVISCINSYYEKLIKWLKDNKDKLVTIKRKSDIKNLNIPRCEFKSNKDVVKIQKTIKLVKDTLEKALTQIQQNKNEKAGKKFLKDAYKELGKII